MAHYEERLEKDLSHIRQQVAKLSARALEALRNALQAVTTGNEKLAYITILGDGRINRAHRDLDSQCYRFIALHLPSAGHLRLISSIIRTNLQLERLGDYAVTIAREAVQLSRPPDGLIGRELDIVSKDALIMLEQSLAAFNEANEDQAKANMHMADNVEGTLDGVYSDLMKAADATQIKDLLAIFVVFNMVKRITDQAKNICEETVFSVTGKPKKSAQHEILFVDEDNSCLGPMAEAIARKTYPDAARYSSAGRQAAAAYDEGMMRFMADKDLTVPATGPRTLEADSEALARYFVIVSLMGPVDTYVKELPFHTSALEWDVGSAPLGLTSEEADRRFQELYREIVMQLRDLIEALTGEEST